MNNHDESSWAKDSAFYTSVYLRAFDDAKMRFVNLILSENHHSCLKKVRNFVGVEDGIFLQRKLSDFYN